MILGDPKALFEELGGMHDACVAKIIWSPEERSVSLHIDDFNSNFRGTKEYKGPCPDHIQFSGTEAILIDKQPAGENLNIYDLNVQRVDGDRFLIEMKFWPGGAAKFICEAIAMET